MPDMQERRPLCQLSLKKKKEGWVAAVNNVHDCPGGYTRLTALTQSLLHLRDHPRPVPRFSQCTGRRRGRVWYGDKMKGVN